MSVSVTNLQKHPLLSLHNEVALLCQPLFRQVELCIFNFIRVYDDKQVIYLCDNYDWLYHYFIHQYPCVGHFEQKFILGSHEYVLWDILDDKDPIVLYSRHMFNIKYGITLIRPFVGGCDFFNFGTAEGERSVLNRLVFKLAHLDHFVQYFYEKAQHLIQTAHRHIIRLEDFLKIPTTKNDKQRLYLGPEYHYQYLTQREITCIKDLIKGLTVPEIAELRGNSSRTIEKHIEHIKNKLGCQTQFELGFLAGKLGIDEL